MLIVSRAILSLTLLGFAFTSYAEEPHVPETVREEQSEETSIRVILLVPNNEALKDLDTAPLSGVVNRNVQLPGNSQKFLDELEIKYLGQPLTQEEMTKIKRAIIRYYRSENHPAVAVRFVQKGGQEGIAVFIISEAKIQNVSSQGPDRASSRASKEHLEKYYDIQTEEYVAQDVLLNNVDWQNRNPFRRTIVPFPQGSEAGTSDLKFWSEDRFPVRFFAGADNSGTKFTGRTRLYGGLTWGHVFGADDLLHYQYTINPTIDKFQSHYGTYIYFLPSKHILNVFATYSTTDPDIRGFHGKGTCVQASFRYTVPLLPLYGPLKQEITAGADYKNTNTNLFFIDSSHPIHSRRVNIAQLVLNYSFERTWTRNEVEFALETFLSPGRTFWLANQSNSAYHTLRPHAKNWYGYGRLTVGDVYQLPRCFSIAGLLRVQASFTPLLPTEQFGLGGYNTVRGYHERAFNADEALCANFEIRSPSLHLMKRCQDELIFLGFIDYGLGFNLEPTKGYPSSGHLLGAGPGVRYQIDTHFSARADYGFRLHKVSGDRSGGGVAHVGVVGIF